MPANDRQVGGTHYKRGGEEHWDRAYRLCYDPFQYIITKWIERWRHKGGVEDLRKAKHAIEKYIEVAEAEILRGDPRKEGTVLEKDAKLRKEGVHLSGDATPDYVRQGSSAL